MKLRLEDKLYKSGLDKNEAHIYSYLLKNDGGTASEIASSTKINRSTVYKTLLRLSVKGVVGETKKGKKQYYFPENPNSLGRYKNSQTKNLQRQTSYIEEMMPQLQDLYTSNKQTTRTLFYEGDDIKKIYDDHISYTNYEMLVIADLSILEKFSPGQSYWKDYVKQKVKNKIKTRGFIPDICGVDAITQQNYERVPKLFQPLAKKLPEKFFSFKGEYIIYGDDRVSIINLKEGQTSGVIIIDKMFNQMMRNFFELVWQSQK